MAFLHSAFIENTAEAREWLYMIGYGSVIIEERDHLVYTRDSKNGWKFMTTYGSAEAFPRNYVDCRGNLPLFKAITAIRYDTNIYQYFVACSDIRVGWSEIDGTDHSSTIKKGEFFNWDSGVEWFDVFDGEYRKAAVKELIEHFKK